MKRTFLTFTLFVSLCQIILAQLPQQTQAFRTKNVIKIDGNLEEADWQKAPLATDFILNEPSPGDVPKQKSEIRILYDNTALYIGAMLYDDLPDSILTQLSERDEVGNTDWFGVVIDSYKDGVNGVGFIVTPKGIQVDTKFSPINSNRGPGGAMMGGDRNWDAVWESEARIVENGWIVEMKILYSALRFPERTDQIWNINFARMVRRSRQLSYWNEVKPEVNGFLNQSGQISGISGIEAPIRLSATPFFSVYAENFYDKNGQPKSTWGRSINGGMDIKYGINDAFTLDMTLIPDFGQVQFDNEVLNLSPFEVRFDENRQFFTEGTELFNKGNLFYSRRVGGRPLYVGNVEGQLQTSEEITDNPAESQLINATKISGRTSKGLGIGVFNAVSAKTTATIKNTETGATREFLTNPLTNYNVVAFDQNLKNNSYFTLINTNVLRNGDAYDANVTGTRFSFRNKAQSYSANGKFALSQKYFTDQTDLGHTWFAELARTSGKFQWELGYSEESDTYDPNDLGFLFNNNERSAWFGTSFNRFEPFGDFNRASVSFFTNYERLYSPNKFTDFGFNVESWAVMKTFFAFGAWTYIEPFETFDYFEPRTDDFSRYYRWPTSANVGAWISTDYRKKFAGDVRANIRTFDEEGRYRFNLTLEPRLRVNDHLFFIAELQGAYAQNDVGWVNTLDNADIIFGVRDNIEWENVLNTTYTFNNKMSLSVRLRHYWAKAEYHKFGLLDERGELAETTYDSFHDRSLNRLTVDAVYRWRFAPGSDIFIVWKNNTSQFDNEQEQVVYSYKKSLGRLGDIPTNNSLSIRVLYYLDYLTLKKK